MTFTNNIWLDYHRSSQDKSKWQPDITHDEAEWPTSWKKIHFKEYTRLPKIPLPTIDPLNRPLSSVLENRKSARDFSSNPINLDKISNLLYWSCGQRDGSRSRFYPSAGKRYPVEIYLINLVYSEDWPEGLFHYNFQDHNLEILWKKSFSREEKSSMFGFPWASQAPVVILMTGVFDRSVERYGERGYRFSLIEAGHIGQNILLATTSLGLSSCAVGDVNDDFFEKLIDLDTAKESLIHTIVIG